MRGLQVLMLLAIWSGVTSAGDAAIQHDGGATEDPRTLVAHSRKLLEDVFISENGFNAFFDSDMTPGIYNDTEAVSTVLYGPVPRIAGGKPAKRNDYPYAASIRINGNHACGATLIDHRVLLTAAHCIHDKKYDDFQTLSAITVKIGNVNRGKGTTRKAKGIVMPDTFNPKRGYYADVALILMDAPVSAKRPKLVTKQKNAKMYRAIGWGKTEDGFLAQKLQQVELRGMSKSGCKSAHKRLKMGSLPKDHFCAGLNSSGADTCSGDSGGPLLSGEYQAGITSYGSPGSKCGKGENLGVYTSVAYWHTWIEDSMSVYNLGGKKAPQKENTPNFNTCLVKGTYKSLTTKSMGECCDKCRESKGCAAWSWTKKSKKCEFKHKGDYKKKKSANCHAGSFY